MNADNQDFKRSRSEKMSAEAGVTAEVYKTIVTIVDERVKEIKVTREDFNALRDVVEELAQGRSGEIKRQFGLWDYQN